MKNLLSTLTHYKAIKAQIDALTVEADAIKADIVAYMDASPTPDKLTVGQYIVTNATVTRSGIDEKRLKAERPDIASEYAKETTYRRLTVK